MIKAVISDIDGTLINTLFLIRHGQYEALAEYLIGEGHDRAQLPTYDEYVGYLNKSVGGPTQDTMRQTLRLMASEKYQQIDAEAVDVDAIDRDLLKPIQDRLAPLYIHPFPELDEFLRSLRESEMKLGIYTSGTSYMIVRDFGVAIPALGYSELYKDPSSSNAEKLMAFTERMKAIYNLADFTVVSADDVTAYKPDPEGVLVALDRLGVAKEEAVVIGDHPYDMQAAKRAGVYAIGVTHGFGSPDELKQAGADVLCANLNEVMYHLQYVM